MQDAACSVLLCIPELIELFISILNINTVMQHTERTEEKQRKRASAEKTKRERHQGIITHKIQEYDVSSVVRKACMATLTA
jgi:hypothetical protein